MTASSTSERRVAAVGVDLGTTFTAAAASVEGRATVVELGQRAASIPSAVYTSADAAVLVGEEALRRGATDPGRLAREFKRRMGDSEPLLLGGTPWAPTALTARLLERVLAITSERLGSRAAAIGLTHPAGWGQFKLDLLVEAAHLAGVAHPMLVSEPVAAATYYASSSPLPEGAVIAVYDLGGGTFDAAVLRVADGRFELVGRPDGLDRFGGIDVDAAIMGHVRGVLGDALGDLRADDAATVAAMRRLRDEASGAKEALSVDVESMIPVVFPHLTTEVRLTRPELESMIAPALTDTITTMRRTLASAGLQAEDLHTILLVGGASRMPVVARSVTEAFERPVSVDAHPKHAVALGAAIMADRSSSSAGATGVAPTAPAPVTPAPAAPPPVTPPPFTAPSVDAGHSRQSAAQHSLAPLSQRRRSRSRGALVVASLLAILAIAGTAAVLLTRDTQAGEARADAATTRPDDRAAEAGDGAGTSTTTSRSIPETPSGADQVSIEPADGPLEIVFDEVSRDPVTNGIDIRWHMRGSVPPSVGPEQLAAHFHYDTQPATSAGINAPDFGQFPGIYYQATAPRYVVPPNEGTDDSAASQICAVVADLDLVMLDPAATACVDLP